MYSFRKLNPILTNYDQLNLIKTTLTKNNFTQKKKYIYIYINVFKEYI